MPIHTPWGPSQHAQTYAEGVVFHETASHGGFHLDPARNDKMHPALRNGDGWYEEDCEAAKVILTFPDLFSSKQREVARATLNRWLPDAYEALFGITLRPGASSVKDERQFLARHAGDWIVTAAISSKQHPGMVECVARKGGVQGRGGERRFLVPAGEYASRSSFGFVIDEARHSPYDGPSGFIG